MRPTFFRWCFLQSIQSTFTRHSSRITSTRKAQPPGTYLVWKRRGDASRKGSICSCAVAPAANRQDFLTNFRRIGRDQSLFRGKPDQPAQAPRWRAYGGKCAKKQAETGSAHRSGRRDRRFCEASVVRRPHGMDSRVMPENDEVKAARLSTIVELACADVKG